MPRPRRTPLVFAVAVACSLAFGAISPAAAATKRPRVAGCAILPKSNVWNKCVEWLPRHPDSAKIKRSIGLDAPLRPDCGSFAGYGIPWNVVRSTTPRSAVTFRWPAESGAGPYPIPADPLIEGARDRHMLMIDCDRCCLYGLFDVDHSEADGRTAGSGAIWKLSSNELRPKGWTSADAAGLPILPGLVRYKEVKRGAIRHALRFTAPVTRRKYIYPARHFASDRTDRYLPPMGLRVRLAVRRH